MAAAPLSTPAALEALAAAQHAAVTTYAAAIFACGFLITVRVRTSTGPKPEYAYSVHIRIRVFKKLIRYPRIWTESIFVRTLNRGIAFALSHLARPID